MVFTKPDGTTATDAPTPAEITALAYDTEESYAALSEPPQHRTTPAPTISAGIFARNSAPSSTWSSSRTTRSILPAESQLTYEYPSGESPDHGFTSVYGANAVHGTPIVDPIGMLAALDGRVISPD